MNEKIKIFSVASFSIYAIINGIVYQWSFWDEFNINIMQFMSINDLLPSIAISIALPVTILVAYSFFMSIIFSNRIFGKIFKVKQGDRPSTLIEMLNDMTITTPSSSKKGNLFIALFIVMFAITLGSYSVYLYSTGEYKEIIMLIVACFIINFLVRTDFVMNHLGNYAFQSILAISLMPHLMCASGIINAKRIQHGKNSYIVKSASICKKENKHEKFRFIANVSDKAFAYSLSDKSICIFKYDTLLLIKESELNENTQTPLHTDQT